MMDNTPTKMQQLLQIMNTHASFDKDCEPHFALIPDENGIDTDNHYGEEEDYYIDELLGSNAKAFKVKPDDKVIVCDMPYGQCHLNAIKEAGEGDTIYTGFAQIQQADGNGSDWFPHTWIEDKDGKLVETFSTAFPVYFGIPLTGENLSIFKDFAQS